MIGLAAIAGFQECSGNVMTHENQTLLARVPGTVSRSLPWEDKFARIGFTRFCVLAAAIALTGSISLLGLFSLANHVLKIFPANPVLFEQPGLATIFGNLVLAPVVETALMMALLKLFVRAGLSPLLSMALSATIWGSLHGTLAPMRFAGSIWSFFVFGYSYFFWSRRQPNRGFAAACLTHSYINTMATAAMFVR